MARIGVYIDGFNLYHAVDALKKPHLKWLDLMTLSKSFMRDGDSIHKVYYFTAILHWNLVKSRRHKRYIDALTAVGVTPIISKFITSSKYCNEFERYCDFKEEKQTDVAFAVTVLGDAYEAKIDKAVLITADSDHIPLIQTLISKFPRLELLLAPPPGRMGQAWELGELIKNRREITEGRLSTCLLPRTVYKSDGKVAATCPQSYTRDWDGIEEVGE